MPVRKLVLYGASGLFALGLGIVIARMVYAPDERVPYAPDALWSLLLPDLHGKPRALSTWRGKVLVLNFWATWCAPCREEIPDLIALRTRYFPHNVEVVGIAIDGATPVARFVDELRMPYPVLIGEGAAQELSRVLGNPTGALPYTVVIDPAGRIRLRHLGRLDRAGLEAVLARTAAVSR